MYLAVRIFVVVDVRDVFLMFSDRPYKKEKTWSKEMVIEHPRPLAGQVFRSGK